MQVDQTGKHKNDMIRMFTYCFQAENIVRHYAHGLLLFERAGRQSLVGIT